MSEQLKKWMKHRHVYETDILAVNWTSYFSAIGVIPARMRIYCKCGEHMEIEGKFTAR